MNAFFLITLAAAVSMLIIPLAWRLAPRLGMVDMPDPRKVHATPIPRVGGWGIVIGCLTPLLVIYTLDAVLLSYVVGVLVLFVFGMWDDAREIGHWPKFGGQILAVAVVVFYGNVYVTRLPFVDGMTLSPELGRAFTMFALVGVINAINHSDGLDGLAGGESMLSLVALAFLGVLSDSFVVVGIALSTIGGTLGFLRYNTHPARVFMGDAGSQVLGFTLGFLAVYLTQIANLAISAALPLLLLGLPLSDILAVLFQRISGGMNWFRATRNHVHHRLLDLGFSHFETVVIIYSIQAALVVSAVLLRYQLDVAVAATYFGVIGVLFGSLMVAERRGWRRRGPGAGRDLALPDTDGDLPHGSWLHRLPLAVVSVLVPVFMLASALWINEVPRDFGVIAALLAVVMLIGIARGRKGSASATVSGAIYVAAAFTTYLFLRYPGSQIGLIDGAVSVGMVALAIAIGIYVRFYSARRFGTTPTDYLIVFGVLALAAYSGTDIRAGVTVQFISYAIVLFYGCEVLIGRIESRAPALHWSTLLTLLIVAAKGIISIW